MSTDTSEKGLETLIMVHMTGVDGLAPMEEGKVVEVPFPDGSGWMAGNPKEFDRANALDVPQLFHFLMATQPEEFKKLGIANYRDGKDIARLKFLTRVSATSIEPRNPAVQELTPFSLANKTGDRCADI